MKIGVIGSGDVANVLARCFRHQLWWPYRKYLGCDMLQPNSALSIPVRVQIGEKCFCQKKLRTTHQQWITEAPRRHKHALPNIIGVS